MAKYGDTAACLDLKETKPRWCVAKKKKSCQEKKKKGERKSKMTVLGALWASGELQRDLLCGISTLFFFFFFFFSFSPLLFSQPQQTIPLTRTSRTDFCFPPLTYPTETASVHFTPEKQSLLFYKVDHRTDQIIISMKN
ncbi:uncharacterized protein TrAFT101_000718 [Trichoderma asperellum]|uniref:uncharacterized protein n=1 Tax=Trichoderma asperellum TaxID=101201 RepID=UPI003327C711|nr:hypothetical protein TrAFT101_000718 [Trichoderma asperellum]